MLSLLRIIYILFELKSGMGSLHDYHISKYMTKNTNLSNPWKKLRQEMELEDLPLQQQLDHFLNWTCGRLLFIQYVKTLAALDLSLGFHRRFRKRSREAAASIYYWTLLAISNVHMHLDGIRGLPDSTEEFRSRLLPQLDLLKNCYLLYLMDRKEEPWKPTSRRSRFIRCKWNAPDLDASYFDGICSHATDRRYANILLILLSETLRKLQEFRDILELGTCLLEFGRNRRRP